MYLIESVYVLRIGQGQYVVVIRVVFFFFKVPVQPLL